MLTNLRETDFWQEECLNYSLLSYIIQKPSNEKFFEAFISQIKKSNNISFIALLYVYEKKRERLVELINKYFPEIFNRILNTNIFSDEMLHEYSFYSLISSELNVLKEMNEEEKFKEYIEGQSTYYGLQQKKNDTLISALKGLDIQFDEINIDENNEFYSRVYEENLYKLNYKNICVFLKTMYNFSDNELNDKKCLTLIFSEPEQPLCKYVRENINEVVCAVLDGIDGVINDSEECVLCVLNSESVSEENKLLYLKKCSIKIKNIEEIQDVQYRVEAIKEGKAMCTVENIINYYNVDKLSDALIKFINDSMVDLDFSNYEFQPVAVKSTFFKECVAAVNLNDEKYIQILRTLKLNFQTLMLRD